MNYEFCKFLSFNGIIHELTCVNTLQQDDISS